MAVSIRKRAVPELLSAQCRDIDNVGDMVRVAGPGAGGMVSVARVDIDAADPHYTVGMIVAKASSTICTVQKGGEVRGVYTGLLPGKSLWVDQNGRLKHDVPTDPSTGVRLVQRAALALDTDLLTIDIQQPVLKIP